MDLGARKGSTYTYLTVLATRVDVAVIRSDAEDGALGLLKRVEELRFRLYG